MVRSIQWLAAGWMIVGLAAPAAAQGNTQRGAVLGGLTGAIAGGVIGDHNHNAGAGAVIGGALGAVAGAALGNARDKEVAATRYQLQQQNQAYRQQAVSTADVVSMVRGGLSDAVVINQVQQRGVQRRLEVSDIILLHEQGVSDAVITSLQQASVPTAAAYAPAPAVTPVIVERYQVVPAYVAPRAYYYRGPYYGPPRHRHYGGSRATFSFGF